MSERGEIVGRITIVQEDRIRVVDALGRGYLLTVGKRRATPDQLAAWHRARQTLRVRYHGRPDLGAVADRIAPEPERRRRAFRTPGRAPLIGSERAQLDAPDRPPRPRVVSPD